VFDTGTENRRAIFGGGRYDDLLSLFSEEQLSGIGFGMGVLMLSLFLKTYNLLPDLNNETNYSDVIYIIPIDEEVANYAIKIADKLRIDHLPSIIDYRFKNLKNQLSKANELGVLITIIIGKKETERNEVIIRNMATNEQKTINFKDTNEEIYKMFDESDDII
jgi:histidyl-tRNA synthetase